MAEQDMTLNQINQNSQILPNQAVNELVQQIQEPQQTDQSVKAKKLILGNEDKVR